MNTRISTTLRHNLPAIRPDGAWVSTGLVLATLAIFDQPQVLVSLRFALFFVVMAALNEVVWRTQSTDVWVTFKVFGLMGLTLLFSIAQAPLMMRHRLAEEAEESGKL